MLRKQIAHSSLVGSHVRPQFFRSLARQRRAYHSAGADAVFLLAGLAGLLNAFSTRLGRVADMVDRQTEALKTTSGEEAIPLRGQLEYLVRRSLVLDAAVVLGTIGGRDLRRDADALRRRLAQRHDRWDFVHALRCCDLVYAGRPRGFSGRGADGGQKSARKSPGEPFGVACIVFQTVINFL